MNLRDPGTLDGLRAGRIVGKSNADYNVEMADGSIEANVNDDRLKPRVAVEALRANG